MRPGSGGGGISYPSAPIRPPQPPQLPRPINFDINKPFQLPTLRPFGSPPLINTSKKKPFSAFHKSSRQLASGTYRDHDGNHYREVPYIPGRPSISKTVINSQGNYEQHQVQLPTPEEQNAIDRDLAQQKTDKERYDNFNAEQKSAISKNDWDALALETQKRELAEATKKNQPSQQFHRDPSQRSFWKTDEEFRRHQESQRRINKRRSQWTDGSTPVIPQPTRAEQQEMAARSALVSGIALVAAAYESGGGAALATSAGTVTAGGTAATVAAPLAAVAVAGGLIYKAEQDIERMRSEIKDELHRRRADKNNVGEANSGGINQTPEAILKNGYYEVNGFKFKETYYKKLWNTGRGAPSLPAKEILKNAKKVSPDRMSGFFKYVTDGWEMVYNPATKEVWHLQPLTIL